MRARAHFKSHPIHPMLVMFPLGLWITSLVFDALGVMFDRPLLWAAAWYCLVGGAVGALLAAVPGAIDLLTVVPPDSSAKKRGYFHAALNVTALLLFGYIAWRRGSALVTPDNTSLLLSTLGVAGVLYAGWLGATLVFRNQIGIDHRYANAGKFKERTLEDWSRPVCNQGELSDGQMMLAQIAGQRIVIGRCAEGIVAFSDHCTHTGGPLHDGALIGCTVQCPWHGSQFDVHSGRVVAGPAEQKIATFEIEIRKGEVFVKRPASAKELPQKKTKRGKEAA